MYKFYTVDRKFLAFANKIVIKSKSVIDVKRAFCITLNNALDLTTDEVANILQISKSTLYRYRNELFQIFNGEGDPRLNWGGRRNYLLDKEEEAKFLSKWEEKARQGLVVDIMEIHVELGKLVGHHISRASTYNLLQRNGWKKIIPTSPRSKKDPNYGKKYNKNTSGYWLPPSK
ncbi:MAG: hypothetical protein LBF22_05825 [Deltaproteobacteria bacterium]|jgi:transposase|nr:hypothetical protein [Deltaproteobacteria bacterium]